MSNICYLNSTQIWNFREILHIYLRCDSDMNLQANEFIGYQTQIKWSDGLLQGAVKEICTQRKDSSSLIFTHLLDVVASQDSTDAYHIQ